MNKIKLLNVRELSTDQKIENNRDYAIMLIASRLSTEIPDTFDDTESRDDFIYRLKVSEVQSIMDLKEKKPIAFEHGKTPSQKLRFRIEAALSKDDYEPMIKYIMSRLDELCDNYIELNNKNKNL